MDRDALDKGLRTLPILDLYGEIDGKLFGQE
jgi:hypothetical protein